MDSIRTLVLDGVLTLEQLKAGVNEGYVLMVTLFDQRLACPTLLLKTQVGREPDDGCMIFKGLPYHI